MSVIALDKKLQTTLFPVTFGIHENETPDLQSDGRFSLLFFDRGLCVGNINGKRHVIDSEGILYLSHHDRFTVDRFERFRCTAIQFDPKYIHDDFTIENLNSNPNNDLHHHADYYLIHPFIHKDTSFFGFIPVGPHSHGQISHCFEGLVKELETRQQKTDMCLCWSRSFLIETLIIAGRMFYRRDHIPRRPAPFHPHQQDSLPEKIILYLHSNYHQKITLGSLSDKFAVNRTSLAELVKKYSGMTVIDYLNTIRVQQACTLLLDSDNTISEICYQSGFGDLSHFGRTFKKMVGVTPSQYRLEYKVSPTV